jgi:hypothetical protein
MMCRAEAIILELQARIEAVKLEVVAMQAHDMQCAETGTVHYPEEYYLACARRVEKLADEISLYGKALPQRYPQEQCGYQYKPCDCHPTYVNSVLKGEV